MGAARNITATLIPLCGGVSDLESKPSAGRIYEAPFAPRCLMLSLFTSFDTERLDRWSPVLLVALLHILLGALIALVAARLLQLRSPHAQLLVLSVSFGNCGSLPFVLTRPVHALLLRSALQL